MKGLAVEDDPAVDEPDVVEPIATEPEPVVDAVAPPIDRRTLIIDHRPPWMRRRLVYQHPELLEFFADRPMDTPEQVFAACRVGVNIWTRGMGAQPELIHEADDLVVIEQIRDIVDYALARLRWVERLTNKPGEPWTPGPGGYDPGPDEDHEADLHPRARTVPRDPHNDRLRPHDGIGWVDDEGNPVDDDDRPMDRTERERAWEAMLS